MTYQELLKLLFADSAQVKEHNNVLTGYAEYQDVKFILAGIVNEAPLNNSMCQQFTKFLLEQTNINPTANIIILVDTAGQDASRQAELLGLNRYVAHASKVSHYLRQQGARMFSLVYGKALGGAFIAAGLNSEKVYALATAQIAVMWLEAMARVTKIPLAKLQELSKTSAIFAPGAENFVKLGAVEAVLAIEAVLPQIIKDLKSPPPELLHGCQQGVERGGRTMAAKIVQAVLNS